MANERNSLTNEQQTTKKLLSSHYFLPAPEVLKPELVTIEEAIGRIPGANERVHSSGSYDPVLEPFINAMQTMPEDLKDIKEGMALLGIGAKEIFFDMGIFNQVLNWHSSTYEHFQSRHPPKELRILYLSHTACERVLGILSELGEEEKDGSLIIKMSKDMASTRIAGNNLAELLIATHENVNWEDIEVKPGFIHYITLTPTAATALREYRPQTSASLTEVQANQVTGQEFDINFP